jgi:hypothetical protein
LCARVIVAHGFFSSGLGISCGAHAGDEIRFDSFDEDTKSASDNPKATCWRYDDQQAAVEHSRVPFYPTLISIAKNFGTDRESAENVP